MSLGSSARTRPSGTRLGVITLGVLSALLLVVSACSSSSNSSTSGTQGVNQGAPTDEGPPRDGGTLRVAVPNEPDSLNPVSARWSLEGNLIGSSIYDTLMTFDENRNLVPRLATSMTPNADGTVWTIKLRPNVQFQDGTPFDASAVKLNIETRKAQPITGDALKPVREAVVIDPLTVEVHMNTPWFGYDYTVAAQGGYMVAPSQINAPDNSRIAIGTGPFKFEGTWSPGQAIHVTKNTNYWGDKAHLDGIEFRTIIDPTSQAAALKSGDVDLIFTQDPTTVTTFRSSPGFVQVEDFAAEETFVMLNLDQAPFDNLDARLALAYGTNRQAVNDAVGGGIQLDANQPYTKDERYSTTDAHYPDYDPTKAQEHLDKYKQATGQSTLSFTLSTPAGGQQQREAELLQAQWAELGIDVRIDAAEQGSYLAAVFGGTFQAGMFRNFAYVNPDSNYIFWHSSFAKEPGALGGINFGALRSPQVDGALDTARKTQDDQTRTAQYQKAVQAINDAVPYIWLYHDVWGLAASDKVGGLGTAQKLGFARQDAKPWWSAIWLKQ